MEEFYNDQGIPAVEEKDDRNFLGAIEEEIEKLRKKALTIKIDDYLLGLCDHIDNISIALREFIKAQKDCFPSILIKGLHELIWKYGIINKKFNYLSEIVAQLKLKKVTSTESVSTHLGSIYKYIELIRKDSVEYADLLYQELYTKELEIKRIKPNNPDFVDNLEQKYYGIIEFLETEKKKTAKDDILKAFEPLINDIIETELNEKGKFFKLLNDKIRELRYSENTDIQKNLYAIIEPLLIDKKTQISTEINIQNIISGLKSLSEADIDEILGNSLIKIIERKSSLFESVDNKINQVLESQSKLEKEIAIVKSKSDLISEILINIVNDCYDLFEFPSRKVNTEDLKQADGERLKRIAKNLILLKIEYKIFIIPYDKKINTERSETIREFLINEGVPESSVVISSNETEKQAISGVRLKLML